MMDRAGLYRSAVLAVTMQWGLRAIGFVWVVVLARLLQPSDFGVVAVAMSAAAFVELFGWIGLRQALLRVSDPDRSYYETAWTIQFITAATSPACVGPPSTRPVTCNSPGAHAASSRTRRICIQAAAS